MLKFLTNNKHLISEGSWVFTGQFINAIVLLFGIRIITEFLSADMLGEATLWLGIVVLLKNVFIQPFLNYQLRYYPENQINQTLRSFNQITFNITLILFISGSLVFAIISLFLLHLEVLNVEYLFLLILVLYFFFDILRSFFLIQLSAERKQRRIALWTIFESITVYFIIYLILSNSPSVSNYVVSMTVGILIGIISFKNYTKRIKNEYQEINLNWKLTLRKALNFSTPLIPIAVLSWIMNLSSRYFIGFIDNLYEAGLFVAAFSISSRPFTMLSGVIGGFLRPILFQAHSNENKQKSELVKKYWLSAVSVLGTAMVLILFFGSDLIANILLAKEYRQTSSLLFLFIGLGYFALAMFQVFENFLLAEKRTKDILYANIFGVIIFIVFSLVLVKEYSSLGAAIAIAVSFVFQFLAAFYFYKYKRNL